MTQRRLIMSFACVLSLSILSNGGFAINILLAPDPWNSHILMSGRLGAALISEGHSVSMVITDNAKVPDFLVKSGIKMFYYKGIGDTYIYNDKQVTKAFFDAKFSKSRGEYMQKIIEIFAAANPVVLQECENFLEDQTLREALLAEKFDYAIVDNVALHCSINFPITLGLDYFILSTPGFLGWQFRIPILPSFVPDSISWTISDEMDFSERLKNTFDYAMAYLFVNMTNPVDMSKYPPYRPIPDLKELTERAVFWFVFDDVTISYPRPLMPNTVNIGDIMVSEGKPLPEDFKQFMDDAPEGVILVSFGSSLDHVPREIINKFCEAFLRVPNKIIWKLQNKQPCGERMETKLKVVPWTPQNDVLAHPNLVLFITHCGINSMLESIYHGKPMLGLPNAAMLKHKGYGFTIDVANFTADEMVSKIHDTLNSDTIKSNMKKASALLKDKPLSPPKRAAYWIEHIHKYGANHIRSGAFKLNLFQFLMLDVWLFLVGLTFVVVLLVFCSMYCMYKCTKRCCKIQSKRLKQE